MHFWPWTLLQHHQQINKQDAFHTMYNYNDINATIFCQKPLFTQLHHISFYASSNQLKVYNTSPLTPRLDLNTQHNLVQEIPTNALNTREPSL